MATRREDTPQSTPGLDVSTPGALLELSTHAHVASLAVYIVVGHGLLLMAIVTGVYTWQLLADCQYPVLWAILCSMALRDTCDDILDFFSSNLRDRTLSHCLLATLYAARRIFSLDFWAWLVGGGSGKQEGGSRLYFKVLALGCFTYLLWPLPLLAMLAYGGWQLSVNEQVLGLAGHAHRILPSWMTITAAASSVEEEEEKGGSKRSRRRRRQHAAGRQGADVPGVDATGAQSTTVDTASPVRSTPPAAAIDEAAPAAAAAAAVNLPPSAMKHRRSTPVSTAASTSVPSSAVSMPKSSSKAQHRHMGSASASTSNSAAAAASESAADFDTELRQILQELDGKSAAAAGKQRSSLSACYATVREVARRVWSGGGIAVGVVGGWAHGAGELAHALDADAAAVVLGAVRPLVALLVVSALLTAVLVGSVSSTIYIVRELTTVAAEVNRLAREPSASLGAWAGDSGLGGYVQEYLPTLLESTQPVMERLDAHMRTHNLTELADIASDVFPQVQHYLNELAAQLRDEGGGGARRAAGPLSSDAAATAAAGGQVGGIDADTVEVVEAVAAVAGAGSERLTRHAVSTAAAYAQDVLSHLRRGRWRAARGVAEAAVRELTLSAESMASVADVVRRCASGLAQASGQVVSQASHVVGGAALRGLALGVRISQLSTSVLMFLFVLYYLLAAERSFVEEIAAVLPVSEAAQEEVAQAITTAVRGVFESALKLAAFHVGLTWLLLSVTGVTRLLGLSMLAAAALSVLPAPPALVILPAVIQLAAQGQLWLGVLVGLVYYLASVSVFWAVYEEIPHAPHPYLTGLSVVGGVTAFPPAWHGALIGPLLLVTMSLILNLYRSFLAKGRQTHQSVHKMRRQVAASAMRSQRRGTFTPATRNGSDGLYRHVSRLGKILSPALHPTPVLSTGSALADLAQRAADAEHVRSISFADDVAEDNN